MALTQLNPPIALITPLGQAMAYLVWSPTNDDTKWGVFQDETGECWWWDNHLVRLQPAISYGRFKTSPIGEKPDFTKALERHRKRYASARDDKGNDRPGLPPQRRRRRRSSPQDDR